MYAIFAALALAFVAVFIVAVRRAYPSLAPVERLALWWWAGIGAIAAVGFFLPSDLAIGLAGLLMMGLGLFVASNVAQIADRLGARRMGIGPFWQQQSPAWWRISGAFLAAIGGGWMLIAFRGVS